MKHSLISSLLTLATVSLQATAAVVDYVSGTPISSSGYYQYHTKWITTTCYHTITKSNDCYNGGDFVGDYETVSPQVYPGPYKDDKSVYETVYETAYPYPHEAVSPYPYETAKPYPYDAVCYPETVYSTVYPESSDKMYHTFTESGTDATVTGSPVYHTTDSTIFETVTATPSGESGSEGSECSTGPWIVNPGFSDPWPGPWFPSGVVERVRNSDSPDGSPAFARFRGDTLLKQAIIIPNNQFYTLGMWYRISNLPPDATFTVVFSFGSYLERVIQFSDNQSWTRIFDLFMGGILQAPSDCVPVVFSIKITYNGEGDVIPAFDITGIEITTI